MLTTDWQTPTGVARERFHRLPPRVIAALVRHGLRSWEQVAQATNDELLSFDGIGRSALATIRAEQRVQRV
jgi:hypothetical protein